MSLYDDLLKGLAVASAPTQGNLPETNTTKSEEDAVPPSDDGYYSEAFEAYCKKN